MRTLTLDLSTTAIGWAFSKEEDTLRRDIDFGEEKRSKDRIDEAAKLSWVHAICIGLAHSYEPDRVIIEESNSVLNVKTTRLLMGARGVVLVALYHMNIKVEFMAATVARKKVGIDTGIPRDFGTKAQRRAELKRRVISWARKGKMMATTDNEADALCLLIAGE
jgi:Holliday junction resolvasome RuvABC endonuclease subunit